MIVQKLLAIVNLGAAWVLWLLIGLSVISVGIMIERAAFYLGRRLPALDKLSRALLGGDLAEARTAIADRNGIEAQVVRSALEQADHGADAVAKVVDAEIKRVRLEYEARLAFLATLGNNAPFIGLFGTVLGIIQAFGDLARNPSAAGASSVMSGISEALIATAVGLLVALPAVVAYNIFQRALRRASQRATYLGDLLEARLRSRTTGTSGVA
ncbi:MAG TPA: MotA/TolQ/ExbB proton channel family protein [Polyangia bacterium]|nr:MotA/TolQ/ExbB proton channel family protein [Polyangia bacterium]